LNRVKVLKKMVRRTTTGHLTWNMYLINMYGFTLLKFLDKMKAGGGIPTKIRIVRLQ